MYMTNFSPEFISHIQRAKELAANRLLRPNFFGNVVGVGVGYKIVDHERTETVCVRIYVQSKLKVDEIAPAYLLPSSFLDIPTDIIEVGNIGRKEINPLQPVSAIHPGSAIRLDSRGSNVNTGAVGTLGAVVVDRAGKRYILGCNHVLSVNGRVKSDPKAQIVAADTAIPPRVIAQPGPFVLLKRNQPNLVDCAVAPVTDQTLVERAFPHEIGDVSSGSYTKPEVGQRVRKIGAITGLTEGSIVDTQADLYVDFSFGTFLFTNQIVIDGLIEGQEPTFANDGDSGAILFDENRQAIGMIFAAAGRFGVACPFDKILEQLGALMATSPAEQWDKSRQLGPESVMPAFSIDTSSNLKSATVSDVPVTLQSPKVPRKRARVKSKA